MKDFRSWTSHMSTRITDRTYLKKTFASPSENSEYRKLEIRKRKKGWQLQSVLNYTQTQ